MRLFILSLFFIILGLGSFAYGVPLELPAHLAFNENALHSGSRIVGGQEARDNHSPHMVGLVIYGPTVASFVCGGSIISDCLVLTAAHCIDAVKTWRGDLLDSLRGVYGSNEWRLTEKSARFNGFINHEGWDPMIIKNDIGVLIVDQRYPVSKKWIAIALNFEIINGGHPACVAGWGRIRAGGPIPDRMHKLCVKTLDHETCAQGVREASGGWGAPPVHPDKELCTRHPNEEGKGMCNGDSGSALVCALTKTLIGLVSWGFLCARGAPDMFVRLSYYESFFTDNMKKCDIW